MERPINRFVTRFLEKLILFQDGEYAQRLFHRRAPAATAGAAERVREGGGLELLLPGLAPGKLHKRSGQKSTVSLFFTRRRAKTSCHRFLVARDIILRLILP